MINFNVKLMQTTSRAAETAGDKGAWGIFQNWGFAETVLAVSILIFFVLVVIGVKYAEWRTTQFYVAVYDEKLNERVFRYRVSERTGLGLTPDEVAWRHGLEDRETHEYIQVLSPISPEELKSGAYVRRHGYLVSRTDLYPTYLVKARLLRLNEKMTVPARRPREWTDELRDTALDLMTLGLSYLVRHFKNKKNKTREQNVIHLVPITERVRRYFVVKIKYEETKRVAKNKTKRVVKNEKLGAPEFADLMKRVRAGTVKILDIENLDGEGRPFVATKQYASFIDAEADALRYEEMLAILHSRILTYSIALAKLRDELRQANASADQAHLKWAEFHKNVIRRRADDTRRSVFTSAELADRMLGITDPDEFEKLMRRVKGVPAPRRDGNGETDRKIEEALSKMLDKTEEPA